MKIEVIIDKNIKEPYIQIYTDQMNDSVAQIMQLIETKQTTIAANREGRMYVLKKEDIYLIQVQDGLLHIYDRKNMYQLNKRLYEVNQILGVSFMQISKGSIVNIKYIESVEASFSGSLKVRLSNGLTDYIARSYVKEFKAYLGL